MRFWRLLVKCGGRKQVRDALVTYSGALPKHVRATPLFDPQQSASPSARYPATPEKGGIVATTVARWAVSDLRDCLSSDVRIDNG